MGAKEGQRLELGLGQHRLELGAWARSKAATEETIKKFKRES